MPHQKILYVYDFLKMWIFYIELIEEGEVKAAIDEVKVTENKARESMCATCHDPDNSPNFKFDKYWKDIAHPGRD